MDRWLRIGGWLVLVLLLLWLAQWIVRLVFGFITWVVTTAITLLVLAVLVYLAYLAVSKLTSGGRGGGGGSRYGSTSRERIFE